MTALPAQVTPVSADSYQQFIASKLQLHVPVGFAPADLSGYSLFDFQSSIVNWAVRRGRAAIFADTGLGKEQPVTEPVLTPSGWSTMGDLRVGDYVVGSNGLPTKVIGVFPQGVKRVYRIELSDGSFARAGQEHLWAVRTKVHRYRGESFEIMTTQQIADSIHRDWQLPIFSPETIDDVDLPIHPYALGVMLGDGKSDEMTYLCTDNWIGDYLGWRKTGDHDTCEYIGYFAGPPDILKKIGDIGLRKISCDKKFVPDLYLHASPFQRLELLNGLMDTDGYPMPDGGSEFSSTSRNLVDSVCSLVRSLGGVARGLRECASTFTYKGEIKKGKQAWRVNLKLPNGMPMFKLPRKAEKHISPSKYPPARIIRAVVDEGVDEGQVCIKVDAADSLYVTRDYIVTHNTSMMLAWADQVYQHTSRPVIILAPLCVAQQTVREAQRMGIPDVRYARTKAMVLGARIVVVNYEMMEHFDPAGFGGVVLDESSILKSLDGKTKAALIESFAGTDYRLSCTATPSPNDFMELGNQAEFLGIMSRTEMLAQFFIHDGGDTSQWRLKGHGKTRFWEWMATWAVCIRNPADLGFDGSRYILPPLQTIQHTVASEFIAEGQLFATVAQTLNDRRAAKRTSLTERVEQAAALVNGNTEKWIVWCHLNSESEALTKAIPGAVEVTGSMPQAEKEKRIMAFINGESRVIVSKSSIMGYGLNLQFCARICFVGLDDSYEQYYQAVRRCYRFGQTRQVEVHIISSEGEGAILKNIERKQAQATEMSQAMVEHMRDFSQREVRGIHRETNEYLEDTAGDQDWTLHLGDCVEVVSKLASDSIGYTVFSPPFASLYTYSNSPRDMGNCRSHGDFYQHFRFLVTEIFRATIPGRLLSFHCTNIPMMKGKDGVIGIHDFRGELIRMFIEAGWIFHSEVVIWKDPVTAMQRTKAIGLLYKQLKKDSCMSRQGIPDYLVTMRKPGVNPNPVTKTPDGFPVGLWQRYASPVWMDINPTRTLQYRAARDNDDERHICPLQLDVIERAIELWSNPGDLVLSPFAGIGSELYVAVSMGRKAIGVELKRSYWEAAIRNLRSVRDQSSIFDALYQEQEDCSSL